MNPRFFFIVITAALASGCATTTQPTATPDYSAVSNPGFARIAEASTKAERDRYAILAMQGEYRVDFAFQETVALAAGYEKRDDKNTGGYEVVLVVEDSPERIVLQHLLVMPGGAVIKHWRQDWVHEASARFEFVADQTWDVVAIEPSASRGTWTQCVYEVSDAPRYCGTGKWNHRYGVSTWTGDRTWRPLPRREYTTRDDYNALNAENRHTVTPNGWTHEQDNSKTVRAGRDTERTLVREFGFNDYKSISGYDFEPARVYWKDTAAYWATVREAWARRLEAGNTLVINTDVDGMPIIEGTFAQAAVAETTSDADEREAVETLLAEYTSVVTDLASARSE